MLPKWPAPVWAAICALVVYLPTLWNGLCRDDEVLLAAGTPIAETEFATLATSHYWAGVEPGGNLYRPVTTLTLAAEELFFPGSAGAHHFGNWVLHALAAFLGCALLAALGVEGPWLLVAGIWLAIHPVRSDAVCEAVQRSELLAFAGMCGVLLCEVRRRRSDTGAAKWLAAIAGLTLLALLSKESALAVVVLLPLMAWLCGDRLGAGGARASWPGAAAAAGAALLYFIVRFSVLGGLGTGFEVFEIDNPYAKLGLFGRLPGAFAAVATYAGLVLAPWALAADYSFPVFDPADGWTAGSMAGLAITAATAVALLPGARKPWRVFGAAWIAVTLGPFANFLFPMGYVAAERALYAPLFGGALWLAAAGTACATRRPDKARALLIGAGVVLALLGCRTLVRTLAWRDNARLYASNVVMQPKASRAWFAHAVARRQAGYTTQAHAAFQRAILLNPGYPEAYGGLGDLERASGRPAEALRWYRKAVEVARPKDPRHHGTLGAFLASQGRYEEGLPYLREAAGRAPEVAAVWHNLVQALALMGRSAEARAACEEAMRLHPADPKLPAMREAILRGGPGSRALTPPPGRR